MSQSETDCMQNGGGFMPGGSPTSSRDVAREALQATRKSIWENPIYIWGVQGGIGIVLMMILGYLVLWSDNHNDSRYLKKEDNTTNWTQFLKLYELQIENGKNDRNSIRSMSQNDKSDIDKKLDRQQAQLDTITADIKSLLRQPSK